MGIIGFKFLVTQIFEVFLLLGHVTFSIQRKDLQNILEKQEFQHLLQIDLKGDMAKQTHTQLLLKIHCYSKILSKIIKGIRKQKMTV